MPIIKRNNPEIYLNYDQNPDPLEGDCDEDCYVDSFDFVLLAKRWLQSGCGDCDGADLSNDSSVDMNDLKILVDHWLEYSIRLYDFDGYDFAGFALTWLTKAGNANWNPDWDISNTKDDIIDIHDLAVFGENWLAGVE